MLVPQMQGEIMVARITPPKATKSKAVAFIALHRSPRLTKSNLTPQPTPLRRAYTLCGRETDHHPIGGDEIETSNPILKLRAAHKINSAFYPVATDVEPHSEDAQNPVRRWNASWRRLTLSTEGLHNDIITEVDDTTIAGDEGGKGGFSLGRVKGLEEAGLGAATWLEHKRFQVKSIVKQRSGIRG
ncbi:hypothetical protein CONLIGDRAFT_108604 [Coniochaeta ligniaria NRRL 30616]|uniref:Uncharacterized protein n=1 Tax=Coniochaeta ligniaria NRRL 30616 TaxID=1408157 RepID=A0A1J7I9I3_9PEZI|nr:hypothetical protein CONLIGDRAFT_108604 [Coniochaeta ligniaria NRRL 30616]